MGSNGLNPRLLPVVRRRRRLGRGPTAPLSSGATVIGDSDRLASDITPLLR
jgi:hypothetical protein